MNRLPLLLLCCAGAVFAAAKYPFPFNVDYPHGIRPALKSTTNEDINGGFGEWITNYYTECPDGLRARIKWVDPAAAAQGCTAEGSCTVSEGIGYGMLILVYMDNATNNTQPKFDKLLKYYKSYPDNKGLMKWAIDGCNGAKQDGAATDAEMDVIHALIMANKQWGNASYLTDALDLLGKVWTSEVDQGAKLLKPGSQWTQSVFNPSYFATGAMRVFQKVDPTHDWNTVADNSLALIKKNRNASTGLVSDWCNAQGQSQNVNGSGTGKFGYDAARTPWRVAMDYLWFGTTAAKEIETPINAWIRTLTNNIPGRIRAQYNQDGTTTVTNWSNALYMGALTIPGMMDSSNATWVQAGLTQLMLSSYDTYFNASWKLIYQLTVTGNLQNLTDSIKAPNGVITHDGRIIPQGWMVRSSSGSYSISLPSQGSADLLDVRGHLLASKGGASLLEFAKPTERGVYFAVVRCAGKQAVLPVISE